MFAPFYVRGRIVRCRVCEERFPSLILLEYHKEDEDHWSYASDELEADGSASSPLPRFRRRRRRQEDFEAKREIMNDRTIEETEFGPSEEDREMLVTSAA